MNWKILKFLHKYKVRKIYNLSLAVILIVPTKYLLCYMQQVSSVILHEIDRKRGANLIALT